MLTSVLRSFLSASWFCLRPGGAADTVRPLWRRGVRVGVQGCITEPGGAAGTLVVVVVVVGTEGVGRWLSPLKAAW